MATLEQAPGNSPHIEIVEQPTQYPLELLRTTFDLHDVEAALAYQNQQGPDAADKLLEHAVPLDFAEKYRSALPLLTYNASRYDPETEKRLQADSIIKALLTRANNHERARAICTRRSLIMLQSSKKEK